MSRNDLTSVEWCELVFQDRNRSYGAYKMRSESRKRHTWAMVAVAGIALVASGIPTLIKFASPDKMEEKIVEVAVLSQLEEPEVKQEEFRRVDPVAPPPALKSSIKFTAPVIKKDEEVTEEDEIKSQAELTESKVNISIADVKGNDELHGKDIAELKEVIVNKDESEKPYTMVEQMPQFPGGDRPPVPRFYGQRRSRQPHEGRILPAHDRGGSAGRGQGHREGPALRRQVVRCHLCR